MVRPLAMTGRSAPVARPALRGAATAVVTMVIARGMTAARHSVAAVRALAPVRLMGLVARTGTAGTTSERAQTEDAMMAGAAMEAGAMRRQLATVAAAGRSRAVLPRAAVMTALAPAGAETSPVAGRGRSAATPAVTTDSVGTTAPHGGSRAPGGGRIPGGRTGTTRNDSTETDASTPKRSCAPGNFVR